MRLVDEDGGVPPPVLADTGVDMPATLSTRDTNPLLVFPDGFTPSCGRILPSRKSDRILFRKDWEPPTLGSHGPRAW